MAKIRPRARLLATIGDQLISGPEAAIIELVKNAYDADASRVNITIAPPKNSFDGCIRCADDGHGMSIEDITSKWFEPATPDKESRRSSPNGRSMLGSKGVGRFAASKLGDKLTLRSVKRVEGELKAAEIHVNWSELSKCTYLDEIDIPVKSSTVESGERTGVSLTIEDLRESWTKPKLERLISELRRLTARDDQSTAFEMHLNLEQVQGKFDAQALVTGIPTAQDDRAIDQRTLIVPPHDLEKIYHYRLIGVFNVEGRFVGEFHNQRAGTKPKAVSFQSEVETEETDECGQLSLELSVFDREPEAIEQLCAQSEDLRLKPTEMRKLLNENVGISIFRSGFRIRPYGDSDYDWLELDKRRVQKPTGRIGHNQVTGKLVIEDAESSSLIERTSREGLEHNNAYRRVRALVLSALLELENQRELYRQRSGLSRKPNPDIKNIRNNARLHRTHSVISKLPRQYQDQIKKALVKDQKGLKTAIDELEAYNHLLASRATVGLVVSQLLHEGERFLGHIKTRTGMVKTRLENWLKQKIISIDMHTDIGVDADLAVTGVKDLSGLFDSIRPIAARRKEKHKEVNLAFVIRKALDLVADRKGNAEIVVQVSDAALSVYVLESCLLAAIINLLDNALYWANQGSAPKVKIAALVTKQFVRLSISNSGPEIEESAVERLFDPGYSTKPEGTGLGLAIAREAMRVCKGDVNVDIEAQITTFVIEMKRQKGD